ncbi:hypothetical protein [Actinokineospora sp. NBRC 105648]|uniref:hypothetical protein n=1 Tax=Actinokineospora sp. NBRC 105648 TaxID=3032206 RepID=UPI0024A47B5E|nr:hypothetical protein [Actinokineospora sp. NBRC 105648]GLZ37968.1 hypothetical protein Acsp05_15920 [Actinokineospora sp. NBRC 105648]
MAQRAVRSTLAGLAVAAATLTAVAVPAASAQAATLPNFRVGLQVADGGGFGGAGVEKFTTYAKFGGSTSDWATDSDYYDPDAVLVDLAAAPSGVLGAVDFRIGVQARESDGHLGPAEFTPWASQGGGTSPLATDDDGYDPDGYRVIVETRAWTAPFTPDDFRLSVEAVDGGIAGVPAFTPWASQGGGKSQYAIDSDGYDPDGIRVGLEVY